MAKKEAAMSSGEEVMVPILKKVSVEVADGGLYFVGYVDDEGNPRRKAATNASALYKTLGEVLNLEKKARKPRQKKAAE